MEIAFANRKLQKTCEDVKKLSRKYGSIQARVIAKRLNELQAALSLQDVKQLPQTRLHLLSANRKGLFAVDVKQPYRIVFATLNGNSNNLETVTKIQLVEIIDYH